MANINIKSKHINTYDAIVIGSGISGGWAAKEFTEKGMKTLVLERGRDVQHISDYPTTNKMPYEFEHRYEIPMAIREKSPIVSRCYAFREDSMHFFTKDSEQPYKQEKPFDWIRGYQVGGKSLTWARQTQRWSNFDFEGPARDGFAVDWPIRYEDLAPWYSHVEKFVGISGNKDGLKELPDGEFLPGYPLNIVENHFKSKLKENFVNRHLVSARCAHLSKPEKIHIEQGRTQCLNRTLCFRGCPFGGYFSSNSSTLPWAARTGNLHLQPLSIVESILYDKDLEKAVGVRVINSLTKESTEYFSKVIFVNASTIGTNQILLNSLSSRFPQGLGNDNGIMGKYLAFHNYRARITADFEGYKDFTTDGRNPASGGYIPRFRNVEKQDVNFLRGYAAAFNAKRSKHEDRSGIGVDLKSSLLNPKLTRWQVGSHMMGETIPKEESTVELSKSEKDAWEMPLVKVKIDYDDNDHKMMSDYHEQMEIMFLSAGFSNIKLIDTKQAPGLDIHEMGGVRMGNDPKTSLLNKYNQLHSCKNVFITDGACMTSTSTQNPSLTYMALTARAVDYAFKELNRREI